MNAKKIVTAGLALVMVAGISVAGTLAYLTSVSAEVKNTFTVGKVAIELDETDITNPEGDRVTSNDYGKVTPGTVYDKDPIVHLDLTSEDCYVFVKVTNGLGDKEAPSVEGGYQTIDAQIKANGWTLYNETDNVSIYYKNIDVSALNGDSDLEVFEEFCISTDVTNGQAMEPITIKAAAIQSAGLELNAAYNEIADNL